jgi:hypothetical protein
MTGNDDLERRIADYYVGEEAARAPGWLLESALATIEVTSQRRGLAGLSSRFPRPNLVTRVAATAVAAIAVGVLGLAILQPGPAIGPGILPGGGTASPSPPSSASPSPPPSASASSPASASPSPSPPALPSPASQIPSLPAESRELEAGTYALASDFPVPVTFDVPAGWFACPMSAVEQVVCGPEAGTGPAMPSVSFLIVDNVVAHPCGDALLDPPVGPSVDDLATAITALEGFQASRPEDLTVDGYRGKQLELAAPSNAVCNLLTWATANRTNGVGPGEVNLLRVFDVDGVRVLVAGAYFPTAGVPDVRTQIQGMLDSVRFGP